MAELVFFTGPMDCGKSTLALQMHHTQASHDRQGECFTSQDRSGQAYISSRIGLSQPAVEVSDDFDFWAFLVGELSGGRRIDYVICDEAQFYQPTQVDSLAKVVDDLGIDCFCFGILADFRSEMFPGSKRLVELADRVEWMPVQPLCWCGARATVNARIIDGEMVTEGSQVLVGDTEADMSVGNAPEAPQVRYEVLCRRHYNRRQPSSASMATLSPELLPFDEN